MSVFRIAPISIILTPSDVYFGNDQPTKNGDEVRISNINAGNVAVKGDIYYGKVEGDGIRIRATSFNGLQNIDVKLYKPSNGQLSYEFRIDEKNVSIGAGKSSPPSEGFSWTMILLFFIIVVILVLGGYFVYTGFNRTKSMV